MVVVVVVVIAAPAAKAISIAEQTPKSDNPSLNHGSSIRLNVCCLWMFVTQASPPRSPRVRDGLARVQR